MPRSQHRLTPTETRARLMALRGWLRQPSASLYTRSEYAEAVDAVLEGGGDQPLRLPERNPNLALWISKDMKEALVTAAREVGGNLTDDVDRGFRQFVEGKFTPTPPIRAKRGANVEKVNLNVRPSGYFREQVEELLEAKSAELGWKVTVSRVAISYLLDLYDIREEDFTVRSGTGTVFRILVPAPLRAHFRAVEAADEDVSLDRLAEDGFRAALAGEFMPPRIPRTIGEGEEGDRRLNVWVDAALYEELRRFLPVLSQKAGYQVSASSVAMEWMKRQLGEPAE